MLKYSLTGDTVVLKFCVNFFFLLSPLGFSALVHYFNKHVSDGFMWE